MHFRQVWMAALGFAIVTATSVPVTAMPRVQTAETRYSALPVHEVQHKRHFDDRRGHWKRTHREGWHNGHRGTSDHRRGQKRHSDGWWYPLAAFGAGAVPGGAISNPQPVGRMHVTCNGVRTAIAAIVPQIIPLYPVQVAGPSVTRLIAKRPNNSWSADQYGSAHAQAPGPLFILP